MLSDAYCGVCSHHDFVVAAFCIEAIIIFFKPQRILVSPAFFE